MKFWPFRQKNETSVENYPLEVQEYYQSGKRERTGVAWLLAFVTLLVTILIGFSTFFAGRWIYRQLTSKKDANTPAQVITKDAGKSETDNSSKTDDNKSNTENSPATTPPQQQPNNTANKAPTTPPPTTQTNIPNTGPAGTMVAFVIASIVGTGLYQLHLRRKL